MDDDAPKYHRRKDERPGELIRAAQKEFAEHGFGDARLARVAKRAGVSNGTLYHYFTDKSDLFQAVFRTAFVEPLMQEKIVSDRPSPDNLSEALRRLLDADTLDLIAILLFESRRYPEPVGRIAGEVLETAEAMLSVFVASKPHLDEDVRAYPLGLVTNILTIALVERARGNADWADVAGAAITRQIGQTQSDR